VDLAELGVIMDTDANSPMDRERVHLLLIADARRGLADVEAGRTCEAGEALDQIQRRRAVAMQRPVAAEPPEKRE